MKGIVSIPESDYKVVDGDWYIRFSTQPSWATALFVPSQCRPTDVRRPLRHAIVFDDIRRLRDEAIDNMTSGQKAPAADIFEDHRSTKYAKTKMLKGARSSFSEVSEIVLPSYDDIDGFPVKVWVCSQKLKCGPIFVQITPDLIEYIMEACKQQVEEGGFSRVASKREQDNIRETTDDDNECGSEDDGRDTNGDVDKDKHMETATPVTCSRPSSGKISDFFGNRKA